MANAEKDIWAKISVNYFDHPKIDVLSDSAQLLHLSLILLAKKQQRAGLVVARACKARGDAALKELVDAGLIHKVDARSYQLHDYDKHQTDEKKVSQKRAQVGGKGAHVTNHVRRAKYYEDCAHCQQDVTDGAEWLKNPDLTLIEAA